MLPLNIPIGKPILSCNATELLQAQINLDGTIYDCDRSMITKSCPGINQNNLVVDDCRGETLECDVRMELNSKSVSCTNGTLISNHPIVCRSATLMENKNVLNCLYKNSFDENLPIPINSPSHSTTRPHVSTTARPIITPQTSLIPPPPVDENIPYINELDVRVDQDRKHLPLPSQGLTKQVQQAMESVFPHGLLPSATSNMYLPPKMYLPPQSSAPSQLSEDLKKQLEGVFPHELFAISQNDDLNTNEVKIQDNLFAQGLSLQRDENGDTANQASNMQNLRSQWDLNLNRNSGNTGPSFKTNPNRLAQRFGAENDDEDRLIFSP